MKRLRERMMRFLGSGDIKIISVVFVIIIGGVLLRFYKINRYDLWFDELISENCSFRCVDRCSRISAISHHARLSGLFFKDQHSAFYYVLVYMYSFFFGGGKSLRIISAIFSILSLIMLYKLARLFFCRRTSCYALLLMALSPMHIWYAQEARAYAMAGFFIVAMLYCFVKALRMDKLTYWGGFILSGVCSLYASYYTLLIFPVLAGFLFSADNRKCTKKWLISTAIIAVCAFPLVPLLFHQGRILKDFFWLPEPNLKTIRNTLMAFSMGYSAVWRHHLLGLWVFTLLFVYGAYSLARQNKIQAAFLTFLFVFPLAVSYLISKHVVPVYLDRQLMITIPFYYLMIAFGLRSFTGRRAEFLMLAMVVILLGTSLSNYYAGWIRPVSYGVWNKKNYYSFLANIEKEIDPGEAIITADFQSYIIMAHYFWLPERAIKPKVLFLFNPDAIEPLEKGWVRNLIEASGNSSGEVYLLTRRNGAGKQELLTQAQLNDFFHDKAWVFSSVWGRAGPSGKNTFIIKNLLKQNAFRSVRLEVHEGICAELFVKIHK